MSKTFLLGFLFSVSLLALASRPAKLPLQGDLVGHWVGYEASYPYLYRLNLRADDTGMLVILYPQGEPDIYSVRWRLNEEQLQLKVLPLTTNTKMLTCHVSKVDFRHMAVAFFGYTNDWKRTALLLNERYLAAGIAQSANYESNAIQKGKESSSKNPQ